MSKTQISMAAVLALYVFAPSVMAWGGLFNRFSPEMLSNMGYGGHGGFAGSRAQPFLQVSRYPGQEVRKKPTGLLCQETGQGRICQPLLSNKKHYGEECFMSEECDVSKGLCCRHQRRHRQKPRNICAYFEDPLVCIGPLTTDQVTNQVEHTAGEKRITGKPGQLQPHPQVRGLTAEGSSQKLKTETLNFVV